MASTLRSTVDRNVAVVKVGYLPKNLRFDYAAQYVNQGNMISPDGTTGTGYRTLSFIDRSVVSDKHSTLDIVSVIQPFTKLADATLGCVKDLGQVLGLLIKQRWLPDGAR
jgi:hypothetical protein